MYSCRFQIFLQLKESDILARFLFAELRWDVALEKCIFSEPNILFWCVYFLRRRKWQSAHSPDLRNKKIYHVGVVRDSEN